MDWLGRFKRSSTSSDTVLARPVVRASPGTAALFERLSEDGSHAVLDLGPASSSSLEVYGRFARRVRFAELISAAVPEEEGFASESIPAQPEHPYDVVLAWDILDRLSPEERSGVIARLNQVTAPNALLHLVVVESEQATWQPFRYTLLDIGRVRPEPIGPPQPAGPPLPPRQVERLIAPFEVLRAFTLRVGVREYLASRARPVTDRMEGRVLGP